MLLGADAEVAGLRDVRAGEQLRALVHSVKSAADLDWPGDENAGLIARDLRCYAVFVRLYWC